VTVPEQPIYVAPFAALAGHRCWRAKRGHSSFLTFDFGDRTDGGRFGEWHLWVQFGEWTIRQGDQPVCDWESSDAEVEEAAKRIEGCALLGVEVSEPSGATRFNFENGLSIAVAPSGWTFDAEGAWWTLFTPDRMILEVTPGPTWSYAPAD